MKTRRIFVCLPADQWLTKQENETKWAIVSKIERLGYTTGVFLDLRGTTSLAGPQAWKAGERPDMSPGPVRVEAFAGAI